MQCAVDTPIFKALMWLFQVRSTNLFTDVDGTEVAVSLVELDAAQADGVVNVATKKFKKACNAAKFEALLDINVGEKTLRLL